jgi:methylenetetrahydrofolate--tRNA-(uracil-5-)-methyltransferase
LIKPRAKKIDRNGVGSAVADIGPFYLVAVIIRKMSEIHIIGGGLAGSEAAYQAAVGGAQVVLYEMRPARMTEAHKTEYLGELVCSNSLRSKDPAGGHGILKAELLSAGSLIMEAALKSEVPAGGALAVDRDVFARYITERLSRLPNIRIIRQEVAALPDELCILATGPLTSQAMAGELARVIGAEHLYFYDAIAPIIDADTVDMEKAWYASRYGKDCDPSADAVGDYLNCPMNRQEYDAFYDALREADSVTARQFESARVFEGCMPVEAMAARGRDTLCFGPLKPVGLINPKTGVMPHAVVQLRTENVGRTAFNMVGFQTRLRQPEQKRVFKMIPGLENAEFLRYGSIHRNTFINSPMHLNRDLSLKVRQNVILAGQITGVEGYLESTAMGLLAGIYASRRASGLAQVYPSPVTAHGALVAYITGSDPARFQPGNINIGAFPPLEARVKDKKKKREAIRARALEHWEAFLAQVR